MSTLFKLLHAIKYELKQSNGVFYVIVFAFLVLLGFGQTVVGAKENPEKKDTKQVLGAKTKAVTATPTVTPTPTPTFRPTTIPRARTIVTATPIPTSPPSPNSSSTQPTLTPVPSSALNATSTNTPIPTSTPTLAPTATPSPTPNGVSVQIGIDYAGQKSPDSYVATVNPGQTAWDAVTAVIGVENIQYTDYGGDLGIFISGFNTIATASNQFYDFRVNGASSSVGVSSYKCNDGDKLEFILTTF